MRGFVPLLAGATARDRLLAAGGAVAGIVLAGIIAAILTAAPVWPLIVAPIGASAVLVFAVPASPLAQPWPVIGGNMLSAAFGVAVAALHWPFAFATGVAVGGAILVMSWLRCLHPPGGAAALSAILLAQTSGHVGWLFPFVPVALDSLLLVAAGIVFHRFSGHSYPHRPAAAPPGFAAEDVDAALAEMHETFDIDRADLDALLARAAAHAAVRRARPVRSSPRR